MIRCRQCNSELIEQARFCNVCGLAQDPQERAQENSTRNGEKTLETNISSQCENCGAEVRKDARFCAICGSAQTSRKSSSLEAPSSKVIPISTTLKNESSTVQLQPSVSIKPAQTIKTVNEHESKAPENASIRSKTVARPPIFPSRPIENGIKPSTTIQQPNKLIPKPSKAVSAVQSINTLADQGERSSDIPIQTPQELSTSTRAPGLIRPVTPISSTRLKWTNYSEPTTNN
jgi:RNA polymerase subunit RPABC4/transcription elongation factor Spt4